MLIGFGQCIRHQMVRDAGAVFTLMAVYLSSSPAVTGGQTWCQMVQLL